MALTTCPDCGKEVSDRAGACPNCGAPVLSAVLPDQLPTASISALDQVASRLKPDRKKWVLVGIAVVAVIAVAILSRGNAPPTNNLGMKFVKIPAGTFIMGNSAGLNSKAPVHPKEPWRAFYRFGFSSGPYDEAPAHSVKISRAFYMSTTVVTQGQWEAVMGNNPSSNKGKDLPVESVSWNDVQAFISRMNQREPGKKGYRLPTEAEWEYACRAGTTGERYGDIDAIAWYNMNRGFVQHPVGQKQPNAWGLYDMNGNVWQWCQDWYGENYYGSSPSIDPQGPSSGTYGVGRGGCQLNPAEEVRSAIRAQFDPGRGVSTLGFRLLWTDAEPPAPSSASLQTGPRPAIPGDSVQEETSRYGTFSIKDTTNGCLISFSRPNSNPIPLFEVPGFRSDSIHAIKLLGEINLPIIARDGEEIHLFNFDYGGNVRDDSEYHVVIINNDKIWSNKKPFGGGRAITECETSYGTDGCGTDGIIVVFTEPPTTRWVGNQYTIVGMKHFISSTIPALPRMLLSQQIVRWTGKLISGFHASNYIPVLESQGKQIYFTDIGGCDLQSLVGHKVNVTAEVKKWSDGANDVTCIAARSDH
jgi:formylglycine-generating enzyme required for sulfatase activity